MKPLCTALLRGIIHVCMCKIDEDTKLQSTENFDTNPDPDPECILICHIRSNTK